jgi:hypothetical protein
MKTDELVDLLSANVESVDPYKVKRTLQFAIFAVLVFAMIGSIAALRVGWNMREFDGLGFLVFKIVFGISITVLGTHYLSKHVRPGGEMHSRVLLTGLPFLAVLLLAAVNLISSPASHWQDMAVGGHWLECLIAIPVIAVLPFAVIMWVVRKAAPTDLARTGALAGLVAGSVGAIAYSLHCTGDSILFVALWYSGTIGLCTIAGGLIGSRLLRW